MKHDKPPCIFAERIRLFLQEMVVLMNLQKLSAGAETLKCLVLQGPVTAEKDSPCPSCFLNKVFNQINYINICTRLKSLYNERKLEVLLSC